MKLIIIDLSKKRLHTIHKDLKNVYNKRVTTTSIVL